MNEYKQSLRSIALDIVDKQSMDPKDQQIIEVYVKDGYLVVVTDERKSRS